MNGLNIAMWSGPRNISTAMMRAWENRPDTQVIDEPFYAHFLHNTGLDHPMRDAVIEQGNTDWREVVEQISLPPATGIVYQKHITTHWLEHYSTDWLDKLKHVFLIRDPESVVASYAIKRDVVNASDLGYSMQAALFDLIISRSGSRPMVIDSERFLQDPESQLQEICAGLGIDFYDSMLSWPLGSRDSDGVWGQHWYDSVNKSSGFALPKAKNVKLNVREQSIADQCMPYYQAMQAFAI